MRADRVDHASDYRWSSYPDNAVGKPIVLLTSHPLYRQMGKTDEARPAAYRALFRSRMAERDGAAIRDATNQAWVLGDGRPKAQIEAKTGRRPAPSGRGGDRKSAEFHYNDTEPIDVAQNHAIIKVLDYNGRRPWSPVQVMLIDTLRSKKALIDAACQHFGARRIRVFGSVARGEETPDSDVDFLVDFPRGYDLFGQRMPLAERLTEIVGRPLDLVPEHELNRHMRARVLEEAIDL